MMLQGIRMTICSGDVAKWLPRYRSDNGEMKFKSRFDEAG